MLHTKYQDSRPGGFRQEDFFMFSLYASQCKKESMTWKCHTHILHTNPRHHEKESKNSNSNIMPFLPKNHNLKKMVEYQW